MNTVIMMAVTADGTAVVISKLRTSRLSPSWNSGDTSPTTTTPTGLATVPIKLASVRSSSENQDSAVFAGQYVPKG